MKTYIISHEKSDVYGTHNGTHTNLNYMKHDPGNHQQTNHFEYNNKHILS